MKIIIMSFYRPPVIMFNKNDDNLSKMEYVCISIIKSKIDELTSKYNMDLMKMVGFLDGINDSLKTPNPIETMKEDTEVSLEEAKAYSGDRIVLYKWRIRSIVEYQSPRPLSQYGLDRPPQGWCYAKGGEPGE